MHALELHIEKKFCEEPTLYCGCLRAAHLFRKPEFQDKLRSVDAQWFNIMQNRSDEVLMIVGTTSLIHAILLQNSIGVAGIYKNTDTPL